MKKQTLSKIAMVFFIIGMLGFFNGGMSNPSEKITLGIGIVCSLIAVILEIYLWWNKNEKINSKTKR
jgi:hypothetical protein